MKITEFERLAPKCIVCNFPMKRTQNNAIIDPANSPLGYANMAGAKYYNINMQCSRNERCFGYMSNAVSIHDPLEVNRFYIGFPRIQIFAVIPEYTQVMSDGHIMKIMYIPFESWLRAKGQTLEKIEKLLLLADGNMK